MPPDRGEAFFVPPKQPNVEHVAVRKFHQDLPGGVTAYEGGGDELYTGPLDLPYLLDPQGPDGQGPLIAEKPTPAPAVSGDSKE